MLSKKIFQNVCVKKYSELYIIKKELSCPERVKYINRRYAEVVYVKGIHNLKEGCEGISFSGRVKQIIGSCERQCQKIFSFKENCKKIRLSMKGKKDCTLLEVVCMRGIHSFKKVIRIFSFPGR